MTRNNRQALASFSKARYANEIGRISVADLRFLSGMIAVSVMSATPSLAAPQPVGLALSAGASKALVRKTRSAKRLANTSNIAGGALVPVLLGLAVAVGAAAAAGGGGGGRSKSP